ncbi:MAG: sulfatase-like hydrolase/transferase [Candidatus Nanohaloarchaea archaeon]|nr:sulfatase-like hydrolase/transferase [Candidatus Nanohaloarchaea archaeon]
MEDIVLITGEAARYDYLDSMEFISSFEAIKCITAGHYTRPCLSAIHSSTYEAAVNTRPVRPTLAEILDRNGYTCIGLTTNPQADGSFGFDRGFEFYDNFTEAGSRGSKLREYLSQFKIVQKVYQWMFSWHKRRYERPSDSEVVDKAVKKFNEAESPRFLWIHMMESHRPYGEGEKGISPELNRKAKFHPGRITEEERKEIEEAYSNSLSRVDSLVEDLLDRIDSDPIFAFLGDHGELLGDHGFYFHPPHERVMEDEITQVPLVFRDLDIDSEVVSQIDVASTLVSAAGLDLPDSWQGRDLTEEERQEFLTFAPRYGTAHALWQDSESRIFMRDGEVVFERKGDKSSVEDVDKSERVKKRLRDFGYIE